MRFEPAAIVNATAAWVDDTLADLGVRSKPLIGGTKGSHFVTFREDSSSCWAAMASMPRRMTAGRCLCFPSREAFSSAPPMSRSQATRMPPAQFAGRVGIPHGGRKAGLSADRALRRPTSRTRLQRCAAAAGGWTDHARGDYRRKHWLEEHTSAPLPFYSIVGGKLTTCRSLAESARAETIVAQLGEVGVVDRDSSTAGQARHGEFRATSSGTLAATSRDRRCRGLGQ